MQRGDMRWERRWAVGGGVGASALSRSGTQSEPPPHAGCNFPFCQHLLHGCQSFIGSGASFQFCFENGHC